MNIDFTDITYKVGRGWKEKGEAKTILHGVSGSFRPGQLCAIMGPSGAGKSTLLNILSGFSSHDGKGSISINNGPLDRRAFYKATRYIQQEDQLPSFISAGEAMHVAASLKLSASTTQDERQAIVDDNLNRLGLLQSYHTHTQNLSGGQQKRLAIALELINNPSVFFLDEPTSGLDNVTTKQILKLLRALAKGGRTIVCTIHQPSASLFDLFDSVYVLGRGRCVYQGSINNLLPFLSSAGFKCPTYHNPADYVIEVADKSDINISVLSKAMDNGKISHTPSKEGINQLDYEFVESEGRQISRQSSSDGSDGTFEDLEYKQLGKASDDVSYPTSGWHQFTVLYTRLLKQTWRNKTRVHLMLWHHVLVGLLVGCASFQIAKNAELMFDNAKFCTGFVLFHAYTNVMQPILVFPNEFKNVRKEYFNRWYGLKAYYAAYTLNQVPQQIVYAAIFNTLVYVMIGLPLETYRFVCFLLIALLTVFTADAFGMAIASTFNATHGACLGPTCIAPLLALSFYGLDFPKAIPLTIQILMKFSFMRNGVIATIIAMYGMDRDTLECDLPHCNYKEPADVLQFGGLDKISIYQELGQLMFSLVVFRVLSYFALRMRLKLT